MVDTNPSFHVSHSGEGNLSSGRSFAPRKTVGSLITSDRRMNQSLIAGFLNTQSKADYVNNDNVVLIINSLVRIGMAVGGGMTHSVVLEDCLTFHEMIILIITSQKYKHLARTPWTETRGFLLNKVNRVSYITEAHSV